MTADQPANPTQHPCRHCGETHPGACPRVKCVEYAADGVTERRVEYHEPAAVVHRSRERPDFPTRGGLMDDDEPDAGHLFALAMRREELLERVGGEPAYSPADELFAAYLAGLFRRVYAAVGRRPVVASIAADDEWYELWMTRLSIAFDCAADEEEWADIFEIAGDDFVAHVRGTDGE